MGFLDEKIFSNAFCSLLLTFVAVTRTFVLFQWHYTLSGRVCQLEKYAAEKKERLTARMGRQAQRRLLGRKQVNAQFRRFRRAFRGAE